MPWSYEQHPTLPVGELVFSGSASADDLDDRTEAIDWLVRVTSSDDQD